MIKLSQQREDNAFNDQLIGIRSDKFSVFCNLFIRKPQEFDDSTQKMHCFSLKMTTRDMHRGALGNNHRATPHNLIFLELPLLYSSDPGTNLREGSSLHFICGS
jgi:hypothetical protein